MNPFLSKRVLSLALLTVSAVFLCAGRMQATEIGGPISSTLTIYDDSELVDDVTCMVTGAPCIAIGASGITLRLNGFTIREDIIGCTPTTASQDGIDVVQQSDVRILGPGLVQGFGGLGIFVGASTRVKVKGVTASDNCFSGILLGGSSDSVIERNVSIRNSIGSEGAPCGGT